MTTSTFDAAVVKGIMQDALSFTAAKSGLAGGEQSQAAVRRGECAVCEYLRYGLALGVAKYLGSMDDAIKAVYTYDPEYATANDGVFDGGPRRSPGISLIAWANRKSAALSSVVGMLSAAIGEELKRLACPHGNALCMMLDVQVIDDSDVEARSGYGALVNSLFVSPLEVWRR
jgi:hypothetical protein